MRARITFLGLLPVALVFIDPAQVVIGIPAGIVTRGCRRLFQPGNGLLPALLFNQVAANVVIRIARSGIDPDRLLALLYGLLVIAEIGVRPPLEGISLRRGIGLYGVGVEFDGLFIFAMHLVLISPAEVL